MKQHSADQIETLQRETAKLKKINAALMSRVERSIDQQFNAFSLFETAIALDYQVLNRTQQLQDALRAIERSNDYLYRAKQQAEAASSLKSSVLISVTHDLLQPLNAARLTLSTFAEMEVSDRGAVLIEQVDRSLLTLEDLLKTLLDISKLDAGVLKPEARPIPISSLFDPLRNELASLAAKRGLSLKIRPSSLAVISDPLMLRRILQNLLTNALRYTQHGGVLMGCRQRVAKSISRFMIPAREYRKRSGRRYFRNSSAAKRIPETAPASGSVFRSCSGSQPSLVMKSGFRREWDMDRPFSVTLPRTELEIYSGAERELQPLDFQFSGLEGAKILIVENDPSSAEAMASLLERWGCDVAKTTSTSDALERIGALGGAPDAIIADLHLDSDESGLEAINAIRRQVSSEIPAMIVTADYSMEAAREAAVYGFELLKKPVKPAEMRSLLSFLLA